MEKNSEKARKIRVMHVVLTMGNGGLENVVLNLCRSIKNPEIEQLVCCLEAEGPLVQFLEELGVPVFFLGKKPGIDFLLPLKLARLFRRQKIDVVHSHDTGANVYGGLGGLFARVKSVVKTEHGGINLVTSSLLKFDTWLSNRLDKVISVSTYLKNQMVQQGVNPKKIIVIPNGIEVEKFQQTIDSVQTRKEFGFEEGDTVIYTVGRFVPLKNTQLLIKVAPKILAEFPQVKFAIIGFGPLEDDLKKMVAEANIQESVKFLGNRTDLPKILPALDIFVLCSRLEGLGLVILEAMAAGKPVIATRVGGIPEIVKDKQNGLLFTTDNEEELIAAIKAYLNQPELRKKLAAAGEITVNSRFTISGMAQAHTKVYRYHFYSHLPGFGYFSQFINNIRQFTKTAFLYFLYYSGIHKLFYRKTQPNLSVVAYHRIVEAKDIKYFPVGLAVTRETFEKHLVLFKKHYQIIDAATLLKHKDDLSTLPRKALLITFDDGYLDNYTVAFDLLKKHQIPGIIFVPTNFIGKSKLFWSDILAYVLRAVEEGECEIERVAGILSPQMILYFSHLFKKDRSLSAKPYNNLLNYLKKQSDREEIINIIIESAATEIESVQEKCKVLSWDQLKEMNENNLHCGAHTLSHPDVTALSAKKLKRELIESKKIIEEMIGVDVEFFAYPYGFYDKKALAEVKQAGYEIAFSLSQGDNKSLFSLSRYNVWEESFKGAMGNISPTILKLELSGILQRIRRGE